MKQILHISCSPKGEAAESYRLSHKVVECLIAREQTAIVVHRSIAGTTIGHVDEDYAVSQHSAADVSQQGSAALSQTLIRELETADFVVIGTPVHNFTVPSALKAWIDHIVRVRWTFNISPQGKLAGLRDRPVFIAFSSGGQFSGEHARQPDFLTPYLTAILGMIGLRDLTFFSVQRTAFGPAALKEARHKADAALREHFS